MMAEDRAMRSRAAWARGGSAVLVSFVTGPSSKGETPSDRASREWRGGSCGRSRRRDRRSRTFQLLDTIGGEEAAFGVVNLKGDVVADLGADRSFVKPRPNVRVTGNLATGSYATFRVIVRSKIYY